MFSSPLAARERILLYGEPATGKSNSVIQLAKFLKLTNPTTRIRVIDNDKSYLLAKEKHDLTNLIVEEVYEFPEYRQALAKFLHDSSPDDWLVCDLMSEAWTAAQTFYADTIYDDEANYFLKVRAAMTQSDDRVMEGWTDWQYINKIYFAFSKPFIFKSPCHVIATSTAEPIARPNAKGKGGDDRETLSVFSSVGFRPEGQKRLRHQFNTTIFVTKDSRGTHRFTTVKDRERELVVSSPLNSFPLDYLKGVAGWVLS